MLNEKRLIKEVKQLVKEGKLSKHDAYWIKGLPADQQMAAAKKMMKNVKFYEGHGPEKSCIFVPKPNTGGRA